MRLISGAQTEIAGKSFRSSAYGDLVRPKIEASKRGTLARFNLLAELARTKTIINA